jgi:hypothetical protein
MQQREMIAPDQIQDPVALAQAIEVIRTKRYRYQGDAFLARFSHSIRPLLPETEYMLRRGVDLIALAGALEGGLDADLFGQVIDYTDWDIDEFNRFTRAKINCQSINAAMRRFLDDPRYW